MRFGDVAYPILVIGLLSLGDAAHAQDWYTGSAVAEKPSRPSASIDLSLTATTLNTVHGTMIGTIAPFAPMDESGLRLRLGGVLGQYSYISTSAGVGRVTGRQEDGSFMAGYEWVSKTTTVDVYVGGEVVSNTLSKPDPSNKVSGLVYGGKIGADIYSNPTTYTMVSANLSYSTANNAYFTRFKVGLAIADSLFMGPEALFMGDNQYSQIRVGLHLTGLKLGMMQFGVSAGFVSDRVSGKGAYGTLDARILF